MSVDLQVGYMSSYVSHDSPAISGVVTLSNGPTTGFGNLLLIGSNFGSVSSWSVGARIRDFLAESQAWVSDSYLVCKTGAGVQKGLFVIVSAGLQIGSATQVVNFDAPSIFVHVPSGNIA